MSQQFLKAILRICGKQELKTRDLLGFWDSILVWISQNYPQSSNLDNAVDAADTLFGLIAAGADEYRKLGNIAEAIAILKEALALTTNWEAKTGLHVHKGTGYFFLGFQWLFIGAVDSAFACFYEALEDDRRIIPKIRQNITEFPSYRTVCLDPSTQNFLQPKVQEIRKYLEDEFIDSFAKERRHRFNFDMLKLEHQLLFSPNSSLDSIRLRFVNIVWSQYSFDNNIKDLIPRNSDNDFLKSHKLALTFDLGLIIDRTLDIVFRKSPAEIRYISNNIRDYFEQVLRIRVTENEWKIFES